jgi:hypothetical protein
MRALQKQVVEGMVAVSAERMKTTGGRGLEDTGVGEKAFVGEEVDWVSAHTCVAIAAFMKCMPCTAVLLQRGSIPYEARAQHVGPSGAE